MRCDCKQKLHTARGIENIGAAQWTHSSGCCGIVVRTVDTVLDLCIANMVRLSNVCNDKFR